MAKTGAILGALFGAAAGAVVSVATSRRVEEVHVSVTDEIERRHQDALGEIVGMVKDVLDGNYGDPLVADISDGRHVVFGDVRTAKMVRVLCNRRTADRSVRFAARAAQFNVPVEGEPIGDPVPTAAEQRGDVIVSRSGSAIIIDNGDVITESLAVIPLYDFADFDPDDRTHGTFRLRALV